MISCTKSINQQSSHHILKAILFQKPKRNSHALEHVFFSQLLWDPMEMTFSDIQIFHGWFHTPPTLEDKIPLLCHKVCTDYHFESVVDEHGHSTEGSPADLFVLLWTYCTRPIPASCSWHLSCTATKLWWLYIGFLPLTCKNLTIPYTSIYVQCFMVAIVFVVMSYMYVLIVEALLAVIESIKYPHPPGSVALALQLLKYFNMGICHWTLIFQYPLYIQTYN